MKQIQLKGRITEILEGGKVTTTDLLSEIRKMPEFGVYGEKYVKGVIDDIILDETIKRVLVEKDGKIIEYWKLNE